MAFPSSSARNSALPGLFPRSVVCYLPLLPALSGHFLSHRLYSDFTRTVTLSRCLPSSLKLLVVSGMILCGFSYAHSSSAVCLLSQAILINTTVLQEVNSTYRFWFLKCHNAGKKVVFLAMDIFCSVLAPFISPVYFPLVASVWLSGWGPEQAGGWQGRLRANTLRLLHRVRRHLNILISTVCPPPPAHVSSSDY